MKINKKQAGLNFSKWHEERILKERTSSVLLSNCSDEEKETSLQRLKSLVPQEGTLFYLPTKSVVDLSERIKINTEKFDFKFLSNVAEKKITFLLGDIFMRWNKTGHKINVLSGYIVEIPQHLREFYPIYITHDISYAVFSFDTNIGAMSFSDRMAHPFSKETIYQFLKLLIFTELSEIETTILNPNQSIGTRREGKYKNDTNNKIVIVDSAWNKNIIITKEFLVSGHFRLQPKGVNLSERELIWIDTYKKQGYKRLAKKLKH